VAAVRFDDYTVSHKRGEEIRNDLKEHGFWYNQSSGMWLTPVTTEKGMRFLGEGHPLKQREYREAIRSHLMEVKTESFRKDPCAAIPAPEAPSYGRYTYNAMNVILTRGRHHFELITNDKETLKKEIQTMARKESLQDYMAVQIQPNGKADQHKTRELRREMGATLDRLMAKNGRRTGKGKGDDFQVIMGKQGAEQGVKGESATVQKQRKTGREMEISR
jgi:hypothetical protein